jgi:DNA-binding transcriptional LysR family regulator
MVFMILLLLGRSVLLMDRPTADLGLSFMRMVRHKHRQTRLVHRVDLPMLLAGVLAGAGVADGPTFVFGERIAAGDLIALLPDHRTSDLAIHALYPSARNLSLKPRRFIDHLIASFGAHPPCRLCTGNVRLHADLSLLMLALAKTSVR